MCSPLLSPIRATCPARHILLDLITRIIFGGEYVRTIQTPFVEIVAEFSLLNFMIDVATTGPCKGLCVLNLVFCMREERELRVSENNVPS